MSSYQELMSQIEELKAQAEEVRRQEVATAITEIRERMNQLGLTADDILSDGRRTRRASAPGSVGVVKYRNPETGQTWTGKGRTPGWIRDAADREVFRVE